jgi:hypothetical protein
MKSSIVSTIGIALSIASTATAFAPSSRVVVPQRVGSTGIFAEENKAGGEKKELVMDSNFENVNIVRLLGLKKVKKMVRKGKRKAAEGK